MNDADELDCSLQPLDSKEVEECLKSLLESKNYLVAVTLIGGEILFGDLHFDGKLFDSLKEAEEENFWIPDRAKKESPNWLWGHKLSPIKLDFNSPGGTIHGLAFCIEVYYELISGINPLSWRKLIIKTIENTRGSTPKVKDTLFPPFGKSDVILKRFPRIKHGD